MKVAIIGTVGVPANYGGFETLVENLLNEKNSSNIEYTVFCSSQNYKKKLEKYKGAQLQYIPLKANGPQSILYDIVSIVKSIRKFDVLLILGVSGCIILPLIRLFCKKKIIINIDGLEHKRDKWNSYIKKFLKYSEALAVRYADVIICDNKGIQDYVSSEYCKASKLIAYGGDHVFMNMQESSIVLSNYNLDSNNYAFSVCRIEPENNVHITLEAFAKTHEKLVFIGNWKRSEYGIDLFRKYQKCSNILLLDPIYDISTLYVLRSNCKFYIHGHSAGGTNPSLVEAMFFEVPILAYDVIYNKESTENKAHYFSNVLSLQRLLQQDYSCFSENGKAMLEIAQRRYTWRTITEQYEYLIEN